MPGDNVIVDLDLDEQALPFGIRLRLGSAVIQLSGKLHAGCHKFRARLGDQALRWVNAKQNRALRLRGVFARILEARRGGGWRHHREGTLGATMRA